MRDISQEKRDQQTRDLLMREVDHRARNALSMVQAVVQLTRAPNIDAYRDIVLGRVSALGRVQGSLAAKQWEGASISGLVGDELTAVSRSGQYALEGPDVLLSPAQVQPLGMIFHELATNAAKYGGLSRETGQVAVRWSDGPAVEILWEESGGPAATAPAEMGFGSRLIEGLARQLRGEIDRDWRPEGLRVRLRLPR